MKRDNWVGFVPYYLLVLILFIAIAKVGNDAATVLAVRDPVSRLHCIVIDAGHGGIDGGATSCSGVLESRINLEIALRLDDLMHFLGYQTVMTRKTDTSIHTGGNSIAAQKLSDLKERVRITNNAQGAILISIHQNIYPDSRYSGAQVFYSANDQSKVLAELTQTYFAKTLNPGSSRKIKKAEGIYLMQHTNCPAILVECGFLSNPDEDRKLQSPKYQKRICCVLASAVNGFINA